ncbi:MAG TPA: T9SS type A sorting domain-containing protein, partial [Bacteroidia bacterium]|nr:T9SS type A sorting domain-containing protein [Bacteroidia bacterium]
GFASSLTFYNGDLCAGGSFTHAGNVNANHVARWGIPASVDENYDPEEISVYPNPADENIHVEWSSDERGKVILTLTDITGRIVLQKEIEENQNNTSTDFDIHSLSNGMYVLRVQNGTQRFTEKLIKE